MSDLEGRVALVTGAARGLGLGIAQVLGARGAHVVLNDIDADELAAASAGLREQGLSAASASAVVSEPESVDALFESAGPVDILVNNAGRIAVEPFLEHEYATWRSVMETNLTSVFLCCRQALPAMIAKGRGSIVNVSSLAALAVTATHASYAASKAAIIAMTRELAYEFGPSGVRVNAIAPGGVASRMSGADPGDALIGADLSRSVLASVRLGRLGRPEEVGNLVAFLASDESSFVTGATITVAGGSDLKIFGT
jgi:NAD(P)-dependent dehydrogenase (short-subunit alcohol dehydrogenase family)